MGFSIDLEVFHLKFGYYFIFWFCDYRDLVGFICFSIFVVAYSKFLFGKIPTSNIRAWLSPIVVSFILWLFSICLVFDEMLKSTKFEIPKFNGKGFVLWKVKIRVILVKDGCVIALTGR